MFLLLLLLCFRKAKGRSNYRGKEAISAKTRESHFLSPDTCIDHLITDHCTLLKVALKRQTYNYN